MERFWEILPGLQLWIILIFSVVASYFWPTGAAIFVIIFDFYWLLKAVNSAIHLFYSYRRFSRYTKLDWQKRLTLLSDFNQYILFLEDHAQKTRDGLQKKLDREEITRIEKKVAQGVVSRDFTAVYHLILIPFYNESKEILEFTIEALLRSNYPKDRMILLLAGEERAGGAGQEIGNSLYAKYKHSFLKTILSFHPDGLEGEIKGKSANAAFAVEHALPELEKLRITIEQVIVSNFDSDTIVHPEYFARVTYEFLLAEKPYRSSYQPIAVYNNNIWDSPAVVRVVSATDSFFQFTESSRSDRLRTFSSHSMTLKALLEVGLWKRDIVNEDGYIYWQCYLHYKGDYHVIPLLVPVSLDTCLDTTLWKTLQNSYKQRRRWAYNVEYWPSLIPRLLKADINLYDKVYKLYQYWEQNLSWALASVLITILGWLPLLIGRDDFASSVTAFQTPLITQWLMTLAFMFLIASVYVNLLLLPKRPAQYDWKRTAAMYAQWALVPIITIFFISIPSIEAQTRLMFGKYLEFWVTPKARKGELTAHK